LRRGAPDEAPNRQSCDTTRSADFDDKSPIMVGGRGPFSGWTLGTMAGVALGSHPRWRLDLAVDRYSVQTLDDVASDAGTTVHLTQTQYGTRLWLMGGVEL